MYAILGKICTLFLGKHAVKVCATCCNSLLIRRTVVPYAYGVAILDVLAFSGVDDNLLYLLLGGLLTLRMIDLSLIQMMLIVQAV